MQVNKNYRDLQTPSEVDTEYVGCCFAQSQPVDIEGVKTGVRLFPGDDTPRTFTKCNLANCEPPPGSILVKCNTTLITRQVLVNTSTIVINEQEVIVGDEVDIIHGRYDQDLGYVYQADQEVPH